MALRGGKGSRARAKLRRKDLKMAAKARKRDLYAQYGEEGRTKSSTRFKRSKKKPLKTGHGNYNCGNPGCHKCFPRLIFKGFLDMFGNPKGMPNWMWNQFNAVSA
jgi:hypothetical protein